MHPDLQEENILKSSAKVTRPKLTKPNQLGKFSSLLHASWRNLSWTNKRFSIYCIHCASLFCLPVTNIQSSEMLPNLYCLVEHLTKAFLKTKLVLLSGAFMDAPVIIQSGVFSRKDNHGWRYSPTQIKVDRKWYQSAAFSWRAWPQLFYL